MANREQKSSWVLPLMALGVVAVGIWNWTARDRAKAGVDEESLRSASMGLQLTEHPTLVAGGGPIGLDASWGPDGSVVRETTSYAVRLSVGGRVLLRAQDAQVSGLARGLDERQLVEAAGLPDSIEVVAGSPATEVWYYLTEQPDHVQVDHAVLADAVDMEVSSHKFLMPVVMADGVCEGWGRAHFEARAGAVYGWQTRG